MSTINENPQQSNNLSTRVIEVEYDFDAIERAPLAESTKYKYKREIRKMIDAGVDLTAPDAFHALADYVDGRIPGTKPLKSSRRQFLRSALRISTKYFKDQMNSGATLENLARIEVAERRLSAMQSVIEVKQTKVKKAHTWLSPAQVKSITSSCPDDIIGRRDWIVLAVLLGAGLRRSELSGDGKDIKPLTFSALKQQPTKDGKMRDILEIIGGKGGKDRVIPIKALLAERLRSWEQETGGGCVARSLGRSKTLGDGLSSVGVFQIVRRFGKKIGVPELAPHDLRRTYAQIGYDSGVPIIQISVLLGHASVKTTQNYLDLDVDLETTASDFIPLSGD